MAVKYCLFIVKHYIIKSINQLINLTFHTPVFECKLKRSLHYQTLQMTWFLFLVVGADDPTRIYWR